jgi:uncharacterized membrane-anchored protein
MPLLSIVPTIAAALEPWRTAYADSAVLSAGLTGVHLVALLFSGGLAVGADRATLRATAGPAPAREAYLAELHAVHRPVLVALAVLFASGALLAAADLETFLASPVFWGKMALVALLLGNGLVMTRTEDVLRRASAAGHAAAPRFWRRLRVASACSLLLWASITVAGAVLVATA